MGWKWQRAQTPDLDFEEHLIELLGARKLKSLLEFVDELNEPLQGIGSKNKTWKHEMLEKIGGKGSLSRIWDRLSLSNKLETRKRKRNSSVEGEEEAVMAKETKKTKLMESSTDGADQQMQLLLIKNKSNSSILNNSN